MFIWLNIKCDLFLPENQMIYSNNSCFQLDKLKTAVNENHPELAIPSKDNAKQKKKNHPLYLSFNIYVSLENLVN